MERGAHTHVHVGCVRVRTCECVSVCHARARPPWMPHPPLLPHTPTHRAWFGTASTLSVGVSGVGTGTRNVTCSRDRPSSSSSMAIVPCSGWRTPLNTDLPEGTNVKALKAPASRPDRFASGWGGDAEPSAKVAHYCVLHACVGPWANMALCCWRVAGSPGAAFHDPNPCCTTHPTEHGPAGGRNLLLPPPAALLQWRQPLACAQLAHRRHGGVAAFGRRWWVGWVHGCSGRCAGAAGRCCDACMRM